MIECDACGKRKPEREMTWFTVRNQTQYEPAESIVVCEECVQKEEKDGEPNYETYF